MKSKLLALVLLATGSLFAAPRVFVGIGVGPVQAGYGYVAAPPYPGPGYDWIDGYWDYSGGARFWHAGYWRAPIVRGYVGPSYYAPRYDRGFIERGHERFDRGHERVERGRSFRR